MLAARAAAQRSRSFGFTPSYRKPAGHVGLWDPVGPRVPMAHQPVVPAWRNRRTGKPHEHNRKKARHA